MTVNGTRVKRYRGMGSLEAMTKGSEVRRGCSLGCERARPRGRGCAGFTSIRGCEEERVGGLEATPVAPRTPPGARTRVPPPDSDCGGAI